jgi:hypothetical protein
MTLLVALASVPICVIVAGTFLPLLDTKVCTSRSEVTGVLIGETSDRTYVGQDERHVVPPLLVLSVPQGQITETFIGGNARLRPCATLHSTSDSRAAPTRKDGSSASTARSRETLDRDSDREG